MPTILTDAKSVTRARKSALTTLATGNECSATRIRHFSEAIQVSKRSWQQQRIIFFFYSKRFDKQAGSFIQSCCIIVH